MAEDDELDDTGSDDNETDAGSAAPEYEPPSAEEWRNTQSALAKANAEAKKHRLALKAEREKSNSGKPASGAPADVEAARAAARAEAAKEYEPKIIAAQARAALIGAGLVIPEDDADGRTLKRALKLLDTDSLSVGDDGSVDGLEAALAELRGDMPSLFKRGAGKAGRVDPGKGGRSGGEGKPKSSAAKLAAGLRAT